MEKKLKQLGLAVLTFLLLGYASAGNNTSSNTAPFTITETAPSEQPISNHKTAVVPQTGNKTISANNSVGREQNIAALVQSNPDLTTLFKLIRAADLLVVLESPADYTLFAPTNTAFNALPAGTLEALMQDDNKLELTRMLQAHILPKRVMSYELKDSMQMRTAQGEEITVQVDGRGMLVGRAQVITPDIIASNGVIHVISSVLLPPQ